MLKRRNRYHCDRLAFHSGPWKLGFVSTVLGNLRNHGDAEGKVDEKKKKNLNFNYESCDIRIKVIYFVYHCENYVKTKSGREQ